MIVVNFATEYYYPGQERLLKSLNGHKSLMIRDTIIGAPSHKESPYEFKIHAIEKAFEYDECVLWCDSSIVLVGELERMERVIERDGYFMQDAGHQVGKWCNQFTRDYFQLQPEEENSQMFIAGLLGLSRRSYYAMTWFREWKKAAQAGCFKGDWKDHRHDMTCGSIIAQRMGLRYHDEHTFVSYVGPGHPEPGKNVVFHCKGI
jgi:hypothetical protein